jgi:hypothetical protein
MNKNMSVCVATSPGFSSRLPPIAPARSHRPPQPDGVNIIRPPPLAGMIGKIAAEIPRTSETDSTGTATMDRPHAGARPDDVEPLPHPATSACPPRSPVPARHRQLLWRSRLPTISGVCAFSVTSHITQRDVGTECGRSGQPCPPNCRRAEPQPARPCMTFPGAGPPDDPGPASPAARELAPGSGT